MKAAIVKYCLLAVLLFALGSAASASDPVYVNPPQFEPQRTLMWDFTGENTWEVPYSAVGGNWNEGQWECDDLQHSGVVQWYDTNSAWPGRQGFIGYNNTGGSEDVSGSITIHINNYSTNNPVKYIWIEAEYIEWGEGTSSNGFLITLPANCAVEGGGGGAGLLADGWTIENTEWEIRPNPSWEELTYTFNIPAGRGILVDKCYVSTACVPEPSSLMALGAGLVGLIGFASKKRRRA